MMTTVRSIILFVVFTLSFSTILAHDPCRFVDSNRVIDLTSVGRTDGHPAYADVLSPAGSSYSMLNLYHILKYIVQYLIIIEYSYNPCKPFSEGSVCQNVSVCQRE